MTHGVFVLMDAQALPKALYTCHLTLNDPVLFPLTNRETEAQSGEVARPRSRI